jgi:hypothetical protein
MKISVMKEEKERDAMRRLLNDKARVFKRIVVTASLQ